MTAKWRREIADGLAVYGCLAAVTCIILVVLAILAVYQLIQWIKSKRCDRWIETM